MKNKTCFILITSLLFMGLSCTESDGADNNDTDSNTEYNTDSSTFYDTDSISDTDSDTDTHSDSDADTVVPTGLFDPELTYYDYQPAGTELAIPRTAYIDKLHGFWLAESVANWTGLTTELDKTGEDGNDFYTDDNYTLKWQYTYGPAAWGSDDDTDIEYIYQHLLDVNNTSILTGEQVRDGWLEHIDGSFIWVSNARAYSLMLTQNMIPPATSDPKNNSDYEMIDAQLTTEIFGLFAPGRPNLALKMARMPVQTTARYNAQWISEFYIIMHSLASYVDQSLTMKEQVFWLAEQARQRLPAGSFSADMYDKVLAHYEANKDKTDWESTRDFVWQRYQIDRLGGYTEHSAVSAGINFASSLVSLFYGGGDLVETIRIGALCGWDSDNPTATWGGLLGFMMGKDAVIAALGEDNLSEGYWIGRTRQNFPDYTVMVSGEDNFQLMGERGMYIIDRVVQEEMGGGVDFANDQWLIPDKGTTIPEGE